MFPLSDDSLPFLEVADFWSREIRPPVSQGEVLDRLEAAWWRGEITGALPRRQFLQRAFEAWQRSSLDEIIFVIPNDGGAPEVTPQADGGVTVDIRPRIHVPSDTESWTEESFAAAFATLAKFPSRKYFPTLGISLQFIELTREEFFGWIEIRGFDLPTFWKRNSAASVSDYRTGALGRPSSSQLVEAELDRRIATNARASNATQEAKLLAAWLKKHHPLNPQMTAKTIHNKFRGKIRNHIDARN
jgi:hypothetical protein